MSGVTGADETAALAAAESVLRGNWAQGERAGVPYAYTRPSPRRYPWQWYWDSCLTAIAWRRFDRSRSRAELESLLAAAHDDGFIGHTIFWERRVSLMRMPYYNLLSRSEPMTSTIQPPLLAWAWSIAVGDPGEDARIGRHYDWLGEHRDLDGDGLLWIIQPDESGLDASPKFDPVWGRQMHGRPGFLRLVARNRSRRFDARAIAGDGGPVLCEVVTNVLHSLALQALGRPSSTAAIVERLYDERSGLFLDEVRPAGVRPEIQTWAALAPLALPDLPEPIGRRLIEEHLLDTERFWLPVAPPSVAATEPTFRPGETRGPIRRYWRGPTWVNSAWLLWLGLTRLGYTDQAREMAGRLCETVAREGLREYYEPYSGEGLGARDFAWSALIAELAEPEPGAARSHL